jgi:trehalose/maltose hydrolase-like predicted phosphorylase
MPDDWTIVESAFRADTASAYEGLFTLGSGYLHVRGSLEEHLSDAPQNLEYTRLPTNVTSERFPESKAKWGTYVPGVFGKHPLLNAEMINLPWFLGLTPTVDGEQLDIEKCQIEEYRRQLRLDTATLSRRLRWRTKSGAVVTLEFERFVSAARPHLCAQRLTLCSDREAALEIRAGIDADVRTNGCDHFVGIELARDGAAGLACCVRTDGGDEVEAATRLAALTGWPVTSNSSAHVRTCEPAYVACEWRAETVGRRSELAANLRLPSNQPLLIEKRTAVATSRDRPARSAAAWLADAHPHPFELLQSEHVGVWGMRWRHHDVVIEDDLQSQLALRASLYHLLRAHPGAGSGLPIDGKGYAGEAYWGRYFWDSEMFLLPFYLYTDPPRARTLTDFRINTLDGARENARRYGYPGARYAWESDAKGNECCPNWQYADHEVHVTADVVYGLAHYARGTGDDQYLRGAGAEVIVETARYWMQRLDWRPGDNHPSLLGVMGPDEFTPISNNNAYTNRLVKFALHLATEVGEAGGASPRECEAFARAADGLPIPRSADGELVLQCEGFDTLAELDLDGFWEDRSKSLGSQVSQERLYRSKCLKQADVLMLMMLFPDEFSEAEVRRAWDYYLPLTTHDSSLSPGVHAIVACRLGLMDEAWRFWQQAIAIDLDVTRGAAAQGIHISNAALVWQVAVLGFAGMKTAMQSDVLTFQPRLPAAWSRLAFLVAWKGGRMHVDIREGRVAVTNRGGSALQVRVGDEMRAVAPQDTQIWTYVVNSA